jgi:hypothetical protein
VRSPDVIKIEVAADRRPGLADAVVGSQIHLLVFDEEGPVCVRGTRVWPGSNDFMAFSNVL